MKISNLLLVSTVGLGAMGASSLTIASIDNDAARVFLQTSCQENGSTVDNCFTDLNTLNTWIWNTRSPAPSASTPLLVKIGTGTFTGQFKCKESGYVTLAGSGMQNTIIARANQPIFTEACENLVFQDMTVKTTSTTLLGVKNEAGSTVWKNVELNSSGYAWFDDSGPGACNYPQGKHYWFGSRIVSTETGLITSSAYFNVCDESWIFGSEIIAKGATTTSTSKGIHAQGGEVHVYGSVIRVLPEGANMNEVVAVQAEYDAEIHVHGTGIDVISSQANDIVALSVANGGTIHANESSYVLETASGSVTRISNNGGSIMAPYLWPTMTTPPDVSSVTGNDTVVVPVSNHPHMLVYDDTCTNNWYDINTNACY